MALSDESEEVQDLMSKVEKGPGQEVPPGYDRETAGLALQFLARVNVRWEEMPAAARVQEFLSRVAKG